MKLTFSNIHWRSSEDSDVFNCHAICEIALNDKKCEITFVDNTYKSPFCNLRYGGGVSHYEFTIMHPYDFGKFINIVIFEHSGAVGIINETSVPAWFENKCKTFCA